MYIYVCVLFLMTSLNVGYIEFSETIKQVGFTFRFVRDSVSFLVRFVYPTFALLKRGFSFFCVDRSFGILVVFIIA